VKHEAIRQKVYLRPQGDLRLIVSHPHVAVYVLSERLDVFEMILQVVAYLQVCKHCYFHRVCQGSVLYKLFGIVFYAIWFLKFLIRIECTEDIQLVMCSCACISLLCLVFMTSLEVFKGSKVLPSVASMTKKTEPLQLWVLRTSATWCHLLSHKSYSGH
jgi:hypothetical protein